MNNIKIVIGTRINSLLAQHNFKQKELAAYLDVTDNTISYFCCGKRMPSVEQIIQIAEFFNVSADYILGVSDVASTDVELNSVCNYTGLSETNCMKLKRMNEIAKGLCEFEDEGLEDVELEEIKKNLKLSQVEYDNIRKKNPVQALEFDEYMKLEPDKRKCTLEGNEMKLKMMELYAEVSFLKEDVEIRKKDLQNIEKSKLEILNCLLSNSKCDNFLFDLFCFSNINLEYDRNIFSVLANENQSSGIPFVFSSNLISNALLQNIQDFIKTLKNSKPQYMLVDVEEINDEKRNVSIKKLYSNIVDNKVGE